MNSMTCNRPDVLCKLEFIDKFKVVIPSYSYLHANVSKFSMRVWVQFTVSFESYIDIGTTYILNMKACLVYLWNKSRNKTSNKWSSLQ